jgi:hypothetical protein
VDTTTKEGDAAMEAPKLNELVDVALGDVLADAWLRLRERLAASLLGVGDPAEVVEEFMRGELVLVVTPDSARFVLAALVPGGGGDRDDPLAGDGVPDDASGLDTE